MNALERLNIDFQTIALIPFKTDIPKEAYPEDHTNIICWGPRFVPRTNKHANLKPGIWYDHSKFRWSAFRENWINFMLCPNGEVVSFDDAMTRLTSDPVFMRPDADSKAFDGGFF